MSDLNARMNMRLGTRHWVKENVDDSELLEEDRTYVEDIVCDIILFDTSVPDLKIKIKRVGDHYNCLFSGWKKSIPFLSFSNTFLDKDRRDRKYDPILSDAEVTPQQDGEGGPYLTVRIEVRASSISNDKRRR